MSLLLILCLLQGESQAQPRQRTHLRQLRAGCLPSKTHLWAMEALAPSSALCWWEASSFVTANALKGPRLVSGDPGGAVTIQCHYTPSSVNRHQRKYWCRLGPPRWICHTVVSSSHYTHHRYQGRVALADFPQSCLFVVRLSQLSLDDAGHYRCGIGDRNDMLFFSMNLTVSAGPSNSTPTAPLAAGDLIMGSSGTTPPVANRWTPGTSQTIERWGTEWNRIAPTPGTSKTTAPAKGRQTPRTIRTVAPGTGSWEEGSTQATAPIPVSPALKIRSMSSTTIRSSVTNKARVSEVETKMTTTKADRPREETERVRIALDPLEQHLQWPTDGPQDSPQDATRKVIGTIKPSALVSEKLAWETLQEATPVSKQQALGSTEGTTPAAGVWTLGTTSIETVSVEGSTEGDLATAAGDSGPPAMTSQALAAGPLRPSGEESSVKSVFPEEENNSRILTPVSAVLGLFMLVALVLLQRKLWRRRTSQEAERAPGVTLIQMTCFLEPNRQPDQLPHVERKMLQDGSAPTQARMTVPERDPGP
ncbi:high affinity immunoglobulin alpha and immunoglobulin mu Fc receptor [Cynocephalus volans]|uniref:high affinity immunoglobulin alpha and immunoglobulin mu Fc receptor n=1 Tax=Cynocephalus volans TaxID=110931 RepID=UPI002FC7AB33